LHRRDPGAKPLGSAPIDDIEMKDEEDDKEKERIEAAKAERQRQREENAKLIAPSAPSKPKRPAFKKKTEQVWPTYDDPEARKRQQLKYEESLPWHLEDFDNKQTWVSMYEAALSGCHVMLMMEENRFRLVPLEKWYRFRDMSKVKRTDPEQVEKLMSKKVTVPTWFLKKQQAAEIKQLQEKDARRGRGLFQRAGDKEEDNKLRGQDLADRPEAPPQDADDIDFDHDELFQDDEENELFEGDDADQKDATEKIKREQRNANIFDLNDENEVDEEEETELKLHEISKQLEKSTRKALLKREKNYDYEDNDSDKDPYASEVCYLNFFHNILMLIRLRASPRTRTMSCSRRRNASARRSEKQVKKAKQETRTTTDLVPPRRATTPHLAGRNRICSKSRLPRRTSSGLVLHLFRMPVATSPVARKRRRTTS
jgi:transcription initiation factor TFIIF subunit alpha